MISATMAVQEEHGTLGSHNPLPESDKNSMDMDIPNAKGTHQLTGDDLAPKVRKPYTITKQRERWTEDEHKKFLEALKLYGRAWRKIEEHVGTKTAVQIRSHAQKFFTKVVRESNAGDSNSDQKPIEIPPPRPKRKPMHPYPRKLVFPTTNGISVIEKPMRSVSSNLSVLEQENQSPTSVLSTVGSDGSDSGNAFGSEIPNLSSEEARSSSPGNQEENSSLDEQITLKLEPSSQNDAVNGENSAAQCLKLFGKTLLVKDNREQSHPTMVTCTPELFDSNEENCALPLKVVPLKLSNIWSAKSDVSFTESNKSSMNSKDSFCPVPLTWLTLCGGASISTPDVHSPTPIKAKPLYERKENVDKEEREGSSTGSSSSDLVEGQKRCDAESNGPFSPERKLERSFFSHKLSKRISADSTVDCRKGFVPYKRCLTKQDSVLSSTGAAEQPKTQRARLCL